MSQYGQPPSAQMYSRPGPTAYAQHPQQMQQQQQPIANMASAYQQPYKGTLAPGTRVKVGNITVTVKRYLSEGGFAHVYLVTTSQPIPMPSSVTGAIGASMASSAAAERGETVHVLKRMAVPDKAALADVRREVEVHKLLRNQPNIVHFIEASATALPSGGYEIFILMEYCSGGGIISLMNARLRDRLREDEVLKIFGDVCAGLAVMHHLDPPLMHRDLKVENILMAPSTDPGSIPGSRSTSSNLKATFKLCDFGSAAPVLSRKPAKSIDEVKRVEADLNKHTTLQYRAPEMVDVYQRRVIDEKADIWALGVLLYKLCYYTTPFEENGGGPLAILNVQYRIPPQPMYSDRLKQLIQSMLKEQSVDRPTIDQVIIDVHAILGTRPPQAALHYAKSAASGKIAGPLPVLVSGAKGAAASGAASSSAPKTAASAGVDANLISMGPTKQELARAEARELELQKQSITPMRRGRPQKPATGAAGAAGAESADIAGKKLDDDDDAAHTKPSDPGAKEGLTNGGAKWSVPETKAPPTAVPTKTAPLLDGFGDSFAPTAPIAPTAATALTGQSKDSSPPMLPKRPTPPSVSPEASGNSINGRAVDKNLLRAATDAPSPVPSPLRHSPALPGFSVAPSPAASPLPPTIDVPSAMPRDELTDRFPSLADLDARFASPSPGSGKGGEGASPSSAPAGVGRVSVPGLANRASVGALAGRFEKPFEPQQPRAGRAPLGKSATISTLGSAERSRAGSVSKRWQPSVLAHDQVGKPDKNELARARPALASRDWLTGDASDDDEKPKPKPKPESLAQLRRSDLPPASASASASPTQAEAGREKQVADESSDDEAGPEPATAQRPVDPRRASDRSTSSTRGEGVDLPKVDVASGVGKSERPVRPRIVPGRVKAPSWLVEAVDSPTAAERLMSPTGSTHAAQGGRSPVAELVSPVTEARAAEQDEAARKAQDQLEELLRGPTDNDEPRLEHKVEKLEEVGMVRGVKAPAWDEDEEDEMKALPKPLIEAANFASRACTLVHDKPDNLEAPPQPHRSQPETQSRPRSESLAKVGEMVDVATSPSVCVVVGEVDAVGEGVGSMSLSRPSLDVVGASISARSQASSQETPVAKRPTPIRPKKGADLSRWSSTTAGSAGMKPWEREAAAVAAAKQSSVVKNTALPSASTALHNHNPPKPTVPDPDRFNGVSSLIQRWQHNVESNAPGWGPVGPRP